MSNPIKYTKGLELWVWDSGELEGFAVFFDGTKVDQQAIQNIQYPIDPPSSQVDIAVTFGGADGGATKIVDTANLNTVLAFHDSGVSHSYTIVK